MIFKYNNREVELEFSGYGDHGDDIQCSSAGYTDGAMEDLTDDEIDDVMDANAGKIEQEQYEHICCHAYDSYKDRD